MRRGSFLLVLLCEEIGPRFREDFVLPQGGLAEALGAAVKVTQWPGRPMGGAFQVGAFNPPQPLVTPQKHPI